MLVCLKALFQFKNLSCRFRPTPANRTLQAYDYVCHAFPQSNFPGPVHSRRLGVSLGINLRPPTEDHSDCICANARTQLIGRTCGAQPCARSRPGRKNSLKWYADGVWPDNRLLCRRRTHIASRNFRQLSTTLSPCETVFAPSAKISGLCRMPVTS